MTHGLWPRLKRLFLREAFFFIVLALTALVGIFSPPDIGDVDWRVIILLFCLMLAAAAFEQSGLLRILAQGALGLFRTGRRMGAAMIAVTGLLSMLLTNDVALLTVVPVTLAMAKLSGMKPGRLIVLETLAANIFSALTPFGNPQNLYIFARYAPSAAEFMGCILPFCLSGGALLYAANAFFSGGALPEFKLEPVGLSDRRALLCGAAVFVLSVLSVLRVLDAWLLLVLALPAVLVLAPRLFRRVDYFLLLTFVLFFLFVSSVTGMEGLMNAVQPLLSGRVRIFAASAALSQVISNVPAAVLLSSFVEDWRPLLLGVSVGGLGTLVASLASLISYRLYAREYPGKKGYLRFFGVLNLAFLVLLTGGALLFL